MYLIITGGPHTTAKAFFAEGAAFSTIAGTKPISPFHSDVSPPGSTVCQSLMSAWDAHSASSRL